MVALFQVCGGGGTGAPGLDSPPGGRLEGSRGRPVPERPWQVPCFAPGAPRRHSGSDKDLHLPADSCAALFRHQKTLLWLHKRARSWPLRLAGSPRPARDADPDEEAPAAATDARWAEESVCSMQGNFLLGCSLALQTMDSILPSAASLREFPNEWVQGESAASG